MINKGKWNTGLGEARIGTTGPQEELVFRTNEPETINNIACVRAEKAKVHIALPVSL